MGGRIARHGESWRSYEHSNAYLGRIVHVVFSGGYNHDRPITRPAIVVRVWTPEMINVQVFADSGPEQASNDCCPPVFWQTSISYDPAGDKVGTWHWPQDKEIAAGA